MGVDVVESHAGDAAAGSSGEDQEPLVKRSLSLTRKSCNWIRVSVD